MALLDALLQDGTAVNVWIAARSDGIAGSGTAQDPFNGGARRSPATGVILTRGVLPSATTREAIVSTGSVAHGFRVDAGAQPHTGEGCAVRETHA